MGISGLTTFVDNNPQLKNDHELHDCTVIIDGNNLCYTLFYAARADSCYGGNYSVYREQVWKYFDILRACGVRAVVVFDGGYDPQSRKIKVSEDRSRQRLRIAVAAAATGIRAGRSRLVPILAMILFQEILRHLKVAMVQCDFEADDYIVALANHLKCPVISQDSDFYIHKLVGGFIHGETLSETFDYKGDPVYRYISCQIYFVQNFIDCFEELDAEILPLFGCLVGNDFVAGPAAFKNLFLNIKLPKIKFRKKLRMSPQQAKILGLLGWLQSRSVKEAIDKVVTFLKKPDRADAKSLLRRTLASYRKPPDTSLLRFIGVPCEKKPVPRLAISNGTPEGVAFPDWFHEEFYAGDIPPFVFNAAWCRNIILVTQVENFSKETAYTCSQRIRQIVYGILNVTREASPEGDKISEFPVIESRRNFKEQRKVTVSPFSSLPKFGKLPDLNSERLTEDRARALIRETLRVDEDFEKLWPKDLVLLWCSVCYWMKETQADHRSVLGFIVVSVFCFFVADEGISKKKKSKKHPAGSKSVVADVPEEEETVEVSETVEDLMRSMTKKDVALLRAKLTRYCVQPTFHKGEKLDFGVIHNLAELQTCYLCAYYLHQLLQKPWGTQVHVHRIFYGTLYYNLVALLKKEENAAQILGQILSRTSTFYKIIFLIYNSLPCTLGKKALLQPLKG